MRKRHLIALDLSTTCTGYAVFDLRTKDLVDWGELKPSTKGFAKLNKLHKKLSVMERLSDDILKKVEEFEPGVIVIEEVTGSRFRLPQKTLDMFHYCVLLSLLPWVAEEKVHYIDVSGKTGWRKVLDIKLSGDDKKKNRRLRQRGRKSEVINFKALAIQYVKKHYNITVRNDEADAICIAEGFLKKFKVGKK